MPLPPRQRRPFASTRRPSHARLTGIVAVGIASLLIGCDTISEDFNDFMQGISPPTPFEAAVWAADFNDPGRQRQGVVLLSNASFGGERPYLELYTTLAEESPDPLVRAAAIRALGRWGGPSEAQVIAGQLGSEYVPVRLESAIALQRIHEPAIVDRIWRRLVDEEETSESVRIELAIALGQYPTDSAFQALCQALDDRSLALNLAAADSLRVMTGRDFGIDAPEWLSWYGSSRTPFAGGETFLYPTYQRPIGFWESLAFWNPTRFEEPAAPRGLVESARRTYDDAGVTGESGTPGEPSIEDTPDDREYQNLGEGP